MNNTSVTQAPWYPISGSKPINFDENDVVIRLFSQLFGLAISVQILLPFILLCLAACKKCFDVFLKEPLGDPYGVEKERQQFEEEMGRRLQKAASAKNQEELDQAVREYRQAVQKYQRKTEKEKLENERSLCPLNLMRLISIHMYVSFYLWVIYLVGCEMTHCTTYGRGRVFYILKILAMVMLGVSAVIVLIESFYSDELHYLKNIMEDETALEYIQRMREVPPKIYTAIECFHYEQRTRTVHYRDAKGNRKTRTETYDVKVVTHLGSEEFRFGSWVDVSKRDMPALRGVALVRFKLFPEIPCGDQETEDDCKRHKEELCESHRGLDEYSYPWMSGEIPGLKWGERISAYVDLRVKPFWIRPLFYWIATLLQMTWPYRWLFRAKTAKIDLFLTKKVYKSTTRPREVLLMEPIDDLVNNKSFDLSSSGPGTGHPMSEMNTPATGNPADDQNSVPDQSCRTSYQNPLSSASPQPNVPSSPDQHPCGCSLLPNKNVKLPVIVDSHFYFDSKDDLGQLLSFKKSDKDGEWVRPTQYP